MLVSVHCSSADDALQLNVWSFYSAVALVVIGCGTGCFKPNISPMIAEQYKRKHVVVRTRKNGSKYLVDPSMTSTVPVVLAILKDRDHD